MSASTETLYFLSQLMLPGLIFFALSTAILAIISRLRWKKLKNYIKDKYPEFPLETKFPLNETIFNLKVLNLYKDNSPLPNDSYITGFKKSVKKLMLIYVIAWIIGFLPVILFPILFYW